MAIKEPIERSVHRINRLDVQREHPNSEPLSVPDPPRGWPRLDGLSFSGLSGEIVSAIEPHTEADPAALLLQFLVAFGNVVGRSAHFSAEADKHHLNLFLALVGETAKARKGTSWGQIDHLFSTLDKDVQSRSGVDCSDWSSRVVSGLSSGEGLIFHAQQSTGNSANGKEIIVLETELASALRILSREGNNLSPVIRNAWDRGDLQTLTKTNPLRVSGAHVSIIAHITRDELRRELRATEMGNGFANRFLWACVRRSRLLPEGGCLSDTELNPLLDRLGDCVGFATNVAEIRRDEAARRLWWAVYGDLSEGKKGLLGAVTARAEAQVMRLACLYALLDQSALIERKHLEAALSIWTFCEESARFIFGDATGDSVADTILEALRASRVGLTRTNIRDLFQRNQHKERIDEALTLLEDRKLAERHKREGNVEIWFAHQNTLRHARPERHVETPM